MITHRAGARCQAELFRLLSLETVLRKYIKINKAPSLKMAPEAAIVNTTKAFRPLRDYLNNHYMFEEEVKRSLSLLYEKYVKGQSSLERAIRSQIEAAPLLEGELKIWLQMINRRLSPQMKVNVMAGCWNSDVQCSCKFLH